MQGESQGTEGRCCGGVASRRESCRPEATAARKCRGRRRADGTISESAWRSKPSWNLDRMIQPPAQRMMAERTGATAEEIAGSHSV
jgi:hypothetical protein